MAITVAASWPTFPLTVGLQSGPALNAIAGNLGSFQSLTATAGGTKAAAAKITAVNVVLAVVATGADSVLLPPGYPGLTIIIANQGAASAQIFGSGTDTIQGAATGTGVALANGATAMYRCVQKTAAGVGVWQRFVSA